MRILWLSNPPGVPSGYGEQAALFLPRIRELGHEIAVAANWGLQGMSLDAGDVHYYPSDGQWGNSSLPTFAEHFDADLVIVLCDAFVLAPHLWPEELRVAVWAPVDHTPLPPPVLAVLADERIRPIAMSRFGERMMLDRGLEPLYVPHGVDTAVFRPQPEMRDQARDELEIPRDAFLVGMVAANQGSPHMPRKGWPEALLAFSRFARDHDDAWLYAHTRPEGTPNGGLELDHLALAAGCPAGRVRFPPPQAWHLGMTSHLVANLYAAFDVLLNPSYGEGFGIPLLEAQACGVPVIASDHSAMTELTQAGWLVDGQPLWDKPSGAWFVMPFIDSIRGGLEAAYEARDDQRLRAGGRAFASSYDADLVAELYWRPALDELAGGRREVGPLRQRAVEKQEAVA